MSGAGAAAAVARTELPLPLIARGKVRDVYDAGPGRLLIVATDRISAFDVILPQPIPGKGRVLTQLTAWWLEQAADLGPHHLESARPEAILAALPELAGCQAVWAHRAMLVRRTAPVLVECVVRGYLAGSGWKEYAAAGTLAGLPLPPGLRESERLEQPVFTPALKAAAGHDENIAFERMVELLGKALAEALRRRSLALYARGAERAESAGILLADTKFEFGLLPDGTVLLIDEVLTPDSSRFWPREHYAPGRGQPSLDKQPVRDYLEGLVAAGAWDRNPPAPDLPAAVVDATAERYRDVYRRLTGRGLEDA
jgi:phosphoribosylaminoimidazole-succinocarboxamide synthase